MPTAKSQTLSIGLHLSALAVLSLLTSHSVLSPPPAGAPHHFVTIAPLRRTYLNRGDQHRGGSNQTLLPARHGSPPPQAHRTFIPPKSMPEPKLPMAITVAFESPTVQIDAANLVDPLSNLRVGELGTHGRNSIGDHGCCGGIGDGDKGSPGITSGAHHNATAPQLLRKVEPEFSEEARKAKYSGVVILTIEVDATGHPQGFRVLQSPGLGLDQKAIDAVTKWLFRPGYQDGKPVVTTATVYVNFRLL